MCKNFISIMAVFKNESMYLKEWIDFHLKSGFDHFYLYDNSDNESAYPVLKKYVDKKIVTHIKWAAHLGGRKAPVSPHRNHFLSTYGKDNTWVAFIDIDEYVFPLQHSNIKDFFIERISDNIGCVVIPSTFFGANGQKKYSDIETYKRFTKRMKRGNHWRDKRAIFKSIARVSSIQNFQSAHKIIVNNKIITEGGHTLSIDNLNKSKIKNGKRVNTESSYLRLNHYWCRSEEEYYTMRNFHGNTGDKKKKKFNNWNKNTNLLEDYKILDFLNIDKPPIVILPKKNNPILQINPQKNVVINKKNTATKKKRKVRCQGKKKRKVKFQGGMVRIR